MDRFQYHVRDAGSDLHCWGWFGSGAETVDTAVTLQAAPRQLRMLTTSLTVGEWINCKVAYRCGRSQDEMARIQFCLVKPSAIKSKTVKLSVDQRSRGPTLADLTKLNLPVISKSREDFG